MSSDDWRDNAALGQEALVRYMAPGIRKITSAKLDANYVDGYAKTFSLNCAYCGRPYDYEKRPASCPGCGANEYR